MSLHRRRVAVAQAGSLSYSHSSRRRSLLLRRTQTSDSSNHKLKLCGPETAESHTHAHGGYLVSVPKDGTLGVLHTHVQRG